MKHIISLILLCMVIVSPQAQKISKQEARFDSAYAKRVLLDEINGVYIPVDLEDAFTELSRLTSQKDLQKLKNMPENIARDKLHFGLGRWMIHNWGFYEGSRLSHHLKGIGLQHPDDMAKVLIVSFHRHLNEQPIELAPQVAFFQQLREKERMLREQNKVVILEETRTRKKNH